MFDVSHDQLKQKCMYYNVNFLMLVDVFMDMKRLSFLHILSHTQIYIFLKQVVLVRDVKSFFVCG